MIAFSKIADYVFSAGVIMSLLGGQRIYGLPPLPPTSDSLLFVIVVVRLRFVVCGFVGFGFVRVCM